MPIAGQLYDRIGPRWPAAIGLLVTAVGTYLLCTTTIDSSNSSVMWLLTLRAAGMGLCMMPIMTGGLSVVPPSQVSQASAFNNVVQRTTAALGLAVLTAMVTDQQAQQIGDRTALIPAGARTPQLGGQADGMSGLLAVYQQTQTHVFVSAINDMYIVTAIVTAAGVVLALMLHHGPPQAVPDEGAPAALTREAEPVAEPGPARERDVAMVGVHANGSGGNGLSGNGSGGNAAGGNAAGSNAAGERDTSAVRG
jgi:MFS family permease